MNKLSRNLAKFNTLSWPEKRIFLAAMMRLPFVSIGLHHMGLLRFQAWLQRKPLIVAGKLTREEMMQLGALINLAARHVPFPATCLTRSLLLCWLLRRKGVEAQLRIGVRLTHGDLEAHAWVEHAGTPINDRQDVSEQYAPFSGVISANSFSSP